MKDSIFIKIYCIIKSQDNTIMTQDEEGSPGWKFPGGHVDKGELLFSVISREVKEETGFKVKLTNLMLVEDFFNRKRTYEHDMRFFVIGELAGGAEKLGEGEVKQLKWFSVLELKNLKKQDVYSPHWDALQKYISGTYYPISILSEVRE